MSSFASLEFSVASTKISVTNALCLIFLAAQRKDRNSPVAEGLESFGPVRCALLFGSAKFPGRDISAQGWFWVRPAFGRNFLWETRKTTVVYEGSFPPNFSIFPQDPLPKSCCRRSGFSIFPSKKERTKEPKERTKERKNERKKERKKDKKKESKKCTPPPKKHTPNEFDGTCDCTSIHQKLLEAL